MRQFICDLAGPLNPQTKKRPDDRRGQHSKTDGCQPKTDGGQHAGLLLQRYLCENATGADGNPEEKRAILQAAINLANNKEVHELYSAAFNRWSETLSKNPAPADLVTAGRLIVGLGSENVLETGIRLHHTYGLPIIPGSALKGLAAHYCDREWGAQDQRFKKPTPVADKAYREFLTGGTKPEDNFHRLLFGTTDDSGCIIFHDAWLKLDSHNPLVLDVMTPHHPRWLDGSVAPTDFDSPVPVPFLSVTGTFRVAVSWRGPEHKQAQDWTSLALELLRDALKNWGIGGKTSSGYGRLVEPPPPKMRKCGDAAKVKIVATRPKGGFEVRDVEPGRNPGTLTLGTPSPDTDTNLGAVVDVLVHVDNAKRPQYKWPPLPKK